jgi:dTMP kinase
VFYLRIGLDELIPRAVFARGFDYWESGMDLYSTEDMYDSFRKYQTALLDQFDRLAEEFHFTVIDARPEPREIFEQLKAGIDLILAPPLAKTASEPAESVKPVEELVVELEESAEERRKRA